jgi:hypothetical protein
MRLPAQAARQLPDQSTTLRVDSSSTDDSRLRGALPNRTALTARFQAIRQANGHAHEFVDAQLGQPGGIAVDAWKMAAECVRAIEASSGPTRRALLRSLQELWIELGNKNKELLQSEQQVLKETQVLYTLHEQFMGI